MMRVLIVEDDPDVAGLVSDVLRSEEMEVQLARTGREGLEAASSGDCDLMVLDIGLPGMNGLRVIKELRDQGNELPVLLLTARNSSDDIVRGLDAGADDYVTKPFEVRVLLARVEAVARRAGRPTAGILQCGDLKLDQIKHEAWRGERPLRLTPKEFNLLRLLLIRQGAATSRVEILRDVWKLDFDPGTGVVDVTISRLRAKLEAGGLSRILCRDDDGYLLLEPR